MMLFVILPILFSACSVFAASSCSTLTPTKSVKPSVASGYQVALVATGLTKPRSIAFDTAGNLMVVESGAGITNLVLKDGGGTCVTVQDRKPVIKTSGVSMHPDRRRLTTHIPSSIMVLLCHRTEQLSMPQHQRRLIHGRILRASHQSVRITRPS